MHDVAEVQRKRLAGLEKARAVRSANAALRRAASEHKRLRLQEEETRAVADASAERLLRRDEEELRRRRTAEESASRWKRQRRAEDRGRSDVGPDTRLVGEMRVETATVDRVEDKSAPLGVRLETRIVRHVAKSAAAVDWLAAHQPERVSEGMRQAGRTFAMLCDRALKDGVRGVDPTRLKTDGGSAGGREPVLGLLATFRQIASLIEPLGERGFALLVAASCGKSLSDLTLDYADATGAPRHVSKAYVTERLVEALRVLAKLWRFDAQGQAQPGGVVRVALDDEALRMFLRMQTDAPKAVAARSPVALAPLRGDPQSEPKPRLTIIRKRARR